MIRAADTLAMQNIESGLLKRNLLLHARIRREALAGQASQSTRDTVKLR